MPAIDDPNVLVGINTGDDAAVYRLRDDLALVYTVDYFTPVLDDPYEFGQVAAANSLSDVYAMGGRPLMALSIVGFPATTQPLSALSEILRGGADKAREALEKCLSLGADGSVAEECRRAREPLR